MLEKPVISWLTLGWIGFVALPWYLGDRFGLANSGLALGLADERTWLLPILVPLMLGIASVSALRRNPSIAGYWLIAIGLSGLIWVGLEGFAIGHRGWRFEWMADLFGAPGPSQLGMGYGAFLTMLALLVLLCHGLAVRGICGGDAFTASALGLIVGITALFVFFPIGTVLASAFENEAGGFAPASFFTAFGDRSIWGLDCLYSGVSCGVVWNSVFLALVVAAGSTALGLAGALIGTRTGFRFKGTLRALTVLPIITPPFVIGLALILLFGRAGVVSTLLSDLFGLPRSRWIYGWPGISQWRGWNWICRIVA